MNKENNFIIQKINRRNEHKFTEKRNLYKKYQKAKWKWTDIFFEIDLLHLCTFKTPIIYNFLFFY